MVSIGINGQLPDNKIALRAPIGFLTRHLRFLRDALLVLKKAN